MHIGTMVEFAYALVAKLDAINKHSFNDFKLRVGMLRKAWGEEESLRNQWGSLVIVKLNSEMH